MNIFIMLHLGLGDAIICAGLISELSKEYETVFIPCYKSNLESVAFMFSDLENVKVQEIYGHNEIFYLKTHHHEEAGHKVLPLGLYANEAFVRAPETFDQSFYRQANVDFSKRWSCFSLPTQKRDEEFKGLVKPTAFICDDESRGFKIHDSKINPDIFKFRPWRSRTIFDFIPLLQEPAVEEIHCINSAFAILVDSIPKTTDKLFLHRYARSCTPYDNFKVRKPWKILE